MEYRSAVVVVGGMPLVRSSLGESVLSLSLLSIIGRCVATFKDDCPVLMSPPGFLPPPPPPGPPGPPFFFLIGASAFFAAVAIVAFAVACAAAAFVVVVVVSVDVGMIWDAPRD